MIAIIKIEKIIKAKAKTYLSVQSQYIPVKMQLLLHLIHFDSSALHNSQFIIELQILPQFE
jgi:hypothetical protein